MLNLCACGSNSDTNNPDDIISETEIEDEDSSDASVEGVDIGNNIILKGDFLNEYSDTKYNGLDINKFLGTLIVKMRPTEYQIADIPVISEDSPNADMIFTLLHLNPDYLVNYALSASSSVTRAYTVAIMQSAPFCEEMIIAAIEARLFDLYHQVKDYPDQLYLVENVVLTQVGDFILFIVCDNAKMVKEEIIKVLTNTDLNTVEIVPFFTDEERQQIEQEMLDKNSSITSGNMEDIVVDSSDAENIDSGE